mmetsp:Transcript_44235/g.71101  ORF Transcript_44235/g.71101 Transcript_44235/m.71101 type:complete len:219 (-) Transcript_44235:656-1312(-)
MLQSQRIGTVASSPPSSPRPCKQRGGSSVNSQCLSQSSFCSFSSGIVGHFDIASSPPTPTILNQEGDLGTTRRSSGSPVQNRSGGLQSSAPIALKRSQRSRNLSASMFQSTKRKRRQKCQAAASASSTDHRSLQQSHSFDRILGSSSWDGKMVFAPPNKMKKLRVERAFDENGNHLCVMCKRASTYKGMFMYLDQVFCSEQCRSEAIAIDEIDILKLS